MKQTGQVLDDLARRTAVALHSDAKLAGHVQKAAAKDDKGRDVPLRRKSDLNAIPEWELGHSVELTIWQVLHHLGRALALGRQGAGRGLAEHWGALKYCQALDPADSSFAELSTEGKGIRRHYKTIQSKELGQGFAVALTEQALARRYPDRLVSIVAADGVMRAGWPTKGGYGYSPDLLAEVWKPSEPSLVIPIATKGNHGRPATSYGQLAACSAHAEALHIGAWGVTPSLLFATELPSDGPVTVHLLPAEGDGGWLRGTDEHPLRSLNGPCEQVNIPPGIVPPAEADENPAPEPGFRLPPQHYAWFQHLVGRTAAAGVAAFSGDGDAIAQYLTKSQGSDHYTTGFAHAASGSVQDAAHKLLGIPFVGTDHVFRLNNQRVEAFSGVAADLFNLLAPKKDRQPVPGDLEAYRREVYARRGTWPKTTRDSRWGGPVSIHDDGTVLAMRLLRL